jgi:aspartate aminotransferase-like enzyme
MNDERHEVINGLDRFGHRLKDMAETARQGSEEMRKVQDQKPADPEAIRKASEALQWRLRLFEEQRRMVTYVCESPALIEQRLGALARAIQKEMDDR